jgi:NFU1 iron-sulfur cluster scaffold homolog, mitochondrial
MISENRKELEMDLIQIKANVDQQDINVCRFTVDQPVYEGTAIFSSKEEAKKHELAEKLFSIPDVTRVEFQGNVVSVTKASDEDWRQVGRRVGGSIRSYLQPPPPGIENMPPVSRDMVQQFLDARINPMVASHGGFVELIDVVNNNVYIRMGGGCQGCGAADITLKQGIERMMREDMPQIQQVLDTTDHASGQNPYYTPSK